MQVMEKQYEKKKEEYGLNGLKAIEISEKLQQDLIEDNFIQCKIYRCTALSKICETAGYPLEGRLQWKCWLI